MNKLVLILPFYPDMSAFRVWEGIGNWEIVGQSGLRSLDIDTKDIFTEYELTVSFSYPMTAGRIEEILSLQGYNPIWTSS